MKKRILLTMLLMSFATLIFGLEEEDLEKFLATNQCINCDLALADLAGRNLSKARLRGADLFGVKLNEADLSEAELVRVIEAAIDNLNKKIEDKKLKVVLHNHLGNKIISIDSDSMTQVFINILDNAIKYCFGESQVTITVKETTMDDKIYAQVEIEAQGEGISSEHLNRLTERFYRIDKDRSRDLGGTGLGLSIVKHILNRHNGNLKIESVLNKGSTFTVYLPILD